MAEFWLPERDGVIILDREEEKDEREERRGSEGEPWVCRGRYGGEEPQSQLFHTASAHSLKQKRYNHEGFFGLSSQENALWFLVETFIEVPLSESST